MTSFQAFAEWAMTLSEGDAPEPVFVVAEHGFPLLELSLDDRAYRIGELVEIDRALVSDEVFAPPAGFRKVTMADMMGRGGQ